MWPTEPRPDTHHESLAYQGLTPTTTDDDNTSPYTYLDGAGNASDIVFTSSVELSELVPGYEGFYDSALEYPLSSEHFTPSSDEALVFARSDTICCQSPAMIYHDYHNQSFSESQPTLPFLGLVPYSGFSPSVIPGFTDIGVVTDQFAPDRYHYPSPVQPSNSFSNNENNLSARVGPAVDPGAAQRAILGSYSDIGLGQPNYTCSQEATLSIGNHYSVNPVSPPSPIMPPYFPYHPLQHAVQYPPHITTSESSHIQQSVNGSHHPLNFVPASAQTEFLTIPTQAPQAANTTPNNISQQSSLLPNKKSKTTTHNQTTTQYLRDNNSTCVVCQHMKVACSISKPCTVCVKYFPEVAERCCVSLTPTLHDSRKSKPDFYNLQHCKESTIPTKTACSTRELTLIHPLQKYGDKILYWPAGPTMQVQIQSQNEIPGIEDEQYSDKAPVTDDSLASTPTLDPQPVGSKQYSIVPSSLPSLDQLVDFERGGPNLVAPQAIESAIYTLLSNWEKLLDNPEHKTLIHQVLSLRSLRRILYGCRPVDSTAQKNWLSCNGFIGNGTPFSHPQPKQMSDSEIEALENLTRLPEPANTQLLTHVVREIEALESEILQKFDSFPYIVRKKPMESSELLLLGLCIRLVSLLYHYGAQQDNNMELPFYSCSKDNQDMIDKLSIRSASLFWKKPWPLHEEWKNYSHNRVFKNNPSLGNDLENVFRVEEHCARHEIEDQKEDQKDIIHKYLSHERKHRPYVRPQKQRPQV